jgi:hypothetical protein
LSKRYVMRIFVHITSIAYGKTRSQGYFLMAGPA